MAELRRTVKSTIPAGSVETPSVAIPAQNNHLKLSMSRENWPAAGITVGLGVSEDNVVWKWFDNAIAAFVATAKIPTVSDAVLEYAWNPAIVAGKQFVKARTNSPSTFKSTITIEAFVRT